MTAAEEVIALLERSIQLLRQHPERAEAMAEQTRPVFSEVVEAMESWETRQ